MVEALPVFLKVFLYFRFSKIAGRIDPALAGLDLRSKFDRRQAPIGARQDITLALLFKLKGANGFGFLFDRYKFFYEQLIIFDI